MSSRKAKPANRPSTQGTTLPPDMSMEGMSSDHTDAATITPEAKPKSSF